MTEEQEIIKLNNLPKYVKKMCNLATTVDAIKLIEIAVDRWIDGDFLHQIEYSYDDDEKIIIE